MGLFNNHTNDNNNTSNGMNGSGTGQHNVRHDAEGLAVGGVGAHELNKHGGGGHHGRNDAIGLGAGGLAGHEYNKHSGGGTGTNNGGGGGFGTGNHASATSANPTEQEARHLERSGKMDKAVGTLIFSKSLKAEGAQKMVEAGAIRQEAAHLNEAQQLESHAQLHRGQAVGLGADVSHANVGAGYNGGGGGGMGGGGMGGGGMGGGGMGGGL